MVDIWTGEKAGVVSGAFTRSLRPHASGLYKFTKQE
ncbi:hypothetical protein [Bacteroides intestinalis]